MSDPYNPYAAPQAASADVSLTAGYGQPMPWTPSEVLSAAWSRINRKWLVLLGAQLVAGILSSLLNYAAQITIYVARIQGTPIGWTFYGGGMLTSICLGSFFAPGLLRLFLDAARNRPLRFETIFLGGDRWLPMLGLQLLLWLVIGLGLCVLVVPGVILGLGFSLAPFYLVDAGMAPVDAMRASWAATKGQWGALFVLGLLCLLVWFAGFFACCVGVLAAGPLIYLTWAITFTRISGRDPVV